MKFPSHGTKPFVNRKYLWSIICLFITTISQGQHPAFRHYSVDDGLPSSEAYRVFQDHHGNMFFLTDRGICLYSGYTFENLPLPSGLSENTVLRGYEDSHGTLWFCTISGRIFSYTDGKIESLPQSSEFRLSEFRHVCNFFVDNQDIIWISFSGPSRTEGILRIAPGKKPENNVIVSPDLRIQLLYMGNNQYLVSENPQNDHYSFRLKDGLTVDANQVFRKEKIIEPVQQFIANDSCLFLSFKYSVLQINKLTGAYIHYPFDDANIYTYLDQKNNLWVGFIKGGVWRFKNGDLNNKPEKWLTGESVSSIYEDREGSLWFTTLDNGVYHLPWEDLHYFEDNNDKCTALTVSGNHIFAGFAHGKIIKYEHGAPIHTYMLPFGHRDNHVQSLTTGENGELFTICSNTFYKINNHRIITSKWSPISRKLVKSSGNEIWCLGNGFFKLKEDSMVYSSETESSFTKWTTCLFEMNDSTTLVGTFNGLWELKKDSLRPLSYCPSLNRRISDIDTIGNTYIFATIGNGLILKDQDSLSFINVENHGLLSNVCNSVFVENDSTFWVATNHGITQIKRLSNQGRLPGISYRSKHITKDDNLKSNEVYDIIVHHNNVWAATNKGLTRFNKSLYDYSRYKIPFYLKEARNNGTLLDPDEVINLPYNRNNLEIAYVALFYKNNKRIRYRYKLREKDPWAYTENTSLQLINLSPDEYTLDMQTSIDGVTWYPVNQRLSFYIKPPFWKTDWFISSSIVSGVFILWLLFHLRYQSIKKEAQMKRLAMESEFKALKAQLNPHFIFNSMNSINSLILISEKFKASSYLTKFSRLMRLTLNNSIENFIPLETEIQTLQLYMEIEAFRANHKFSFEIKCGEGLDKKNYLVSAMLVQPFIENAIWHGLIPLQNSGGYIRVHFKAHSSKGLKCIIDDDGMGREARHKMKQKNKQERVSMGIQLIEDRLKVMRELWGQDFRLDIQDKKNDTGQPLGTRVTIIMPVKIRG